jgi:ornithine carbamoyltransferase
MDINKFTPMGNINKRHLISLANFTEEEIYEILYKAKEISIKLAAGEKLNYLKNKYVTLLTKRSFARSRIAFETAVTKLGGFPMISTMHGSELEIIIKDKLTIEAIAGYGVNAIVVQTAEANDAEQIEKSVNIPIINANSKSGPCEALAALLTVWKKKGKLSGLKLAMVGDPAIYADSFIYAFANCGFDITIICPEDKNPPDEIINHCNQYGDLVICQDLEEGLKGADVIFVSNDGLGYEYMIDSSNVNLAKPDAIILHTLPVIPNESLSEDVISSHQFVAVEEALHLPEIEMAILSLLIAKQKSTF